MPKPFVGNHTLSDHVDPTHEQWARPLAERLELLKDFDYRAVLGADTNLDHVKFTTWTPAHCSCQVTYIWHRDSSHDDRVHHPLIQHRLCDDHSHHKGNHVEHFKVLQAESKAHGEALAKKVS